MIDPYYYCVVKTKLESTGNKENLQLAPILPCLIYSYVAVSNGKSITYSRNMKLVGEEILATIAVKLEDRKKIKSFTGYLGNTFNKVKNTKVYKKHYPFKVKDVERKVADDNTFIEYNGDDKDEPARFCIWEETND